MACNIVLVVVLCAWGAGLPWGLKYAEKQVSGFYKHPIVDGLDIWIMIIMFLLQFFFIVALWPIAFILEKHQSKKPEKA